jgi:hypothetical protein
MRESVNQVNIEGIINEIRINEIDKGDKKYISGDVIVKVNDKDGLVSYIPVSFISANKKTNGEPNKVYQNLQALKSFNSIASAGEGDADLIQIRGAKITQNMFVPKGNDEVVVSNRISSNFFTRIQKQNFNPEATFNVITYILDIQDEQKNYEGELQDTGRLIITGALVGYNDRVDIAKFIVEDSANVAFIKNHYAIGDTVRIGGKLNYTEEPVTVEREVGFGEAETRTYTKRKRELIVLRGSAGPLDEEESFKEEDIKKALTERMGRMEAAKQKAQAPAPSQPSRNDYDF